MSSGVARTTPKIWHSAMDALTQRMAEDYAGWVRAGCVPYGDPPSQPIDTSEDAADSMKVVAGSMRAKALIWITSRGTAGSTVDEAEAALGMRHQTISARFYELEGARCIVRQTDTRVTRSGRKARVYTVTPLGAIRAKMAMDGYKR